MLFKFVFDLLKCVLKFLPSKCGTFLGLEYFSIAVCVAVAFSFTIIYMKTDFGVVYILTY